MSNLFASGHIIDFILALVALEGVGLTVYHHARGRGIAPREFGLNLLSGGCLMVAIREALVQAPWWLVAAPMLAALIAHAGDLARRWRS